MVEPDRLGVTAGYALTRDWPAVFPPVALLGAAAVVPAPTGHAGGAAVPTETLA